MVLSVSKQEPRPSVVCMTPNCQREPRQDGECWMCPDCKKKLEQRIAYLERQMMDIELNRDMWKRRVEELHQQTDLLPTDVQQALHIAADALCIADDHNLVDVQVNPPKQWGLEAYSEDAAEGWCSTTQLARKLREIAG
jgi:hypothetical protein